MIYPLRLDGSLQKHHYSCIFFLVRYWQLSITRLSLLLILLPGLLLHLATNLDYQFLLFCGKRNLIVSSPVGSLQGSGPWGASTCLPNLI